MEYASELGYGIVGWGSSEVVFATEAAGSATLAVDPGGYNYDVTVTIPVDGTSAIPATFAA